MKNDDIWVKREVMANENVKSKRGQLRLTIPKETSLRGEIFRIATKELGRNLQCAQIYVILDSTLKDTKTRIPLYREKHHDSKTLANLRSLRAMSNSYFSLSTQSLAWYSVRPQSDSRMVNKSLGCALKQIKI